ncbi:MAG: hypothetical protein H6722_16995 [Sandaracinus sp.]|nr:hypothetical protein [Sandaracinus sp.]MCB9619371.1 hypothetical protein [Sandaracinus sp.]MCB9621923.1 hypothetical protein [Sandaracinus sp.]
MSNEDDTGQHAADEPTAMWDEDALAQLGLGGPAEPAPKPQGPGLAVSVETASHATAPAAPARKSSMVGWVVTVVLAIGLGVAVYFVVRALR